MLRIMANENLEWNQSPAVINETVHAAKDFLDGELAKYETWAGSNRSIRPLFSEEGGFQKAKKEGAGRDTILKFLGGNWKQWMVQEALAVPNDDDVDREAIEQHTISRASDPGPLRIPGFGEIVDPTSVKRLS